MPGCGELRGAFSLIVMSPRKLIACRDPWGFRPLCMGRKGKAVLFASESCAIESVGAPWSGNWTQERSWWWRRGRCAPSETTAGASPTCASSNISTARPDSVIAGQSVHEARVNAGRLLARRHPVEADLVVGGA